MEPSLTSRPGRRRNLLNSTDPDDDEGDQMIRSTLDLLERGEKETKLDDEHRDLILVLGNTGSGKSTFTQWVAGDNTKLTSKETEEGTGEYIIEDHNRIGDSSLKSKTIFPELAVDPKTNAAYYDCPSFSETKGTSRDIARTYFLKKVIEHSKSVKMVFTVSYPSVRKGVGRHDFIKLIKHVTDFVMDIKKFRSSIAIIATKVDNQYVKQGKNFFLVDDDKVIAAIADFFQEVKEFLEDSAEYPNLSVKEKIFYENAIKFVDILLDKDGDQYSRIGIFRRPDEPGPVSNISLLQKGKRNIEKIVHEKFFTEINNEDFRYTVSEKTKADVIEIGPEIENNLWYGTRNIAEKIQNYYENLVDQVRCKVYLFVTESDSIDLSPSEAEMLVQKFRDGYYAISEIVDKLESLTNLHELVVIVNSTVSNLDINNIPENDMIYIVNQGKYFNFLQTVNDRISSSKPWDKLFKDVGMFLLSSVAPILQDADLAVQKINDRIQLAVNSTVEEIKKEYTENINSYGIQKLPEKLNRDRRVVFEVTELIQKETTDKKLVNGIHFIADSLGIPSPKENLERIANLGKYLKFFEILKDNTINIEPTTILTPFKNIAKYVYESEKWYTFLDDLYSKLSEYEIQKDRRRYNFTNFEDWGQPGPRGIEITSNTFQKFLEIIKKYNVTEYDAIKNLTTTGSQIEELNQVLSITLQHRAIVRCSEPYITVRGSYISLNETMQNIISNTDTNDSCKNFKTNLASGKYTLFKLFALNTVFIDTDLTFSGKGTSLAIIAPKWEVIGSRSFDLNGVDGAPNADYKAKSGYRPGENGVSGAPGKPGGSGESFFGIGADFVNGMNLTINSNGGRGSQGQEGGDGAPGVPGLDARTPSTSDPFCEKGYVLGLKCEEVERGYSVISNDGSMYSEVPIKINGLPGGKGGNGGDGGKGAKGGDPGNITILELNHPSEIVKVMDKGKEEENGKAGVGAAEGGVNGDDVIALWSFLKPAWISRIFGQKDTSLWLHQEKIKNNGSGPPGFNGTDGANALGLENPTPANGIPRPPNIINEYKSYLRESLNDRLKKHYLGEFLDQLDNKKDSRELYDTLGLIDEFRKLEEQFHKLSEKMDFFSFYRSLLEKIHEFAKTRKDDKNSGEYKKVLSYLYTATLSRIYNLSENKGSNLMIDIRGYLNLLKENMQTMKDLPAMNSTSKVANNHKEYYEKGIDKKIEQTKTFINEKMNPEIENINTEIESQVNNLIEETIVLQKQATKENRILDDKRRKLENVMVTKGFFICLQITGGVMSSLVEIGEIAGSVIEATSTVHESLALNNQQPNLNLPSNIVWIMKSLGDQILKMKNRKFTYLDKLVDDLLEKIKRNPEKLIDITGKIVKIKDKLNTVKKHNFHIEQIKMLEGELKIELKKKGEYLKLHASDEKSIHALKMVEEITQTSQFEILLLETYNEIKEENEKARVIYDTIKKIQNKIKDFREYEEMICDTVSPMLQEMEDSLKHISDKFGTKSQVALDITKWRVQSVLKDIKLQMERLTTASDAKEPLGQLIENLYEIMATSINIYDRIQSFQEQQNLVNYVTGVSSVAASSINIKDQKLVNAVNHFKFVIRSNIVLKQYKSAVDAFNQWVFPFADRYEEKLMVPSQHVLDTNIQDLVQNATQEIETMHEILDLYHVSVENSDQFLQHGEFNSRYDSSQPFYTWKNIDFGSLISNLLSGKEVVLKADVKDSVSHKDAIKFSEIDFYFKTKNQTAQSSLSEILKGFDIRATHLGNSYYKYSNKIYLITSDSLPISYSFEKNAAGAPIRRNTGYDKLKSGDLMLSPYTMWEVRLINATNKYSFQDLESYKGKIDLELSGSGSYVNTSAFDDGAYRSFIVSNYTKLPVPKSTATDVNQCTKLTHTTPPGGIGGGGGAITNGAPTGSSSPINVLCNFLKTYLVSNTLISINQLIFRGKTFMSERNDCSVMREGGVETETNYPTMASNSRTKITMRPDVNSVEGKLMRNRVKKIELTSDFLLLDNCDGHNSCSKPLLSWDKQEGTNHQSFQVPEINSSLLLADVVTRTITGNKYKMVIDESLLSPQDIISEKINGGIVQTESDVLAGLQRILSEEEEEKLSSRSWLSMLNSFAKLLFDILS